MGHISPPDELKPLPAPMRDKFGIIMGYQTKVEASLNRIVEMVGNLTSHLAEIQNSQELSHEQVEELKNDITTQETETDNRTKTMNV